MAEHFSSGYITDVADNFVNTFKNGVLAIYSGAAPGSADSSEGNSTLLCLITKDAQPFTPGQPDNGLSFKRRSPTYDHIVVERIPGERWAGEVIAAGEAKWFRFYDNNYTTGANATAKRFDGSITQGVVIGNLSYEMFLSVTSVKPGDILEISQFSVTIRMS